MIILVGSQKGGSGKSTLATNLAGHYAQLGKDVCLVDADRQGTSSRWNQERAQRTDVSRVTCVGALDDVRSALRDLRGRYELVVVDVAGHDSKELRTAMAVADRCVLPFRPSQADLDTLAHMTSLLSDARDFNEKLLPRVVLTMCPTNARVKEADEARIYLHNFDMPSFKTLVHDRKAYRDALSEGLAVSEMPAGKAAANEIKKLADEVLAKW